MREDTDASSKQTEATMTFESKTFGAHFARGVIGGVAIVGAIGLSQSSQLLALGLAALALLVLGG